MLRVGLTGGIACGKSHVLRRLREAGLHTLDLDSVVHEVTVAGSSVHAELVRAFGPAMLAPDGTIDRKALAAIVFADPQARARLNAIVHPRVREEEARRAEVYAQDEAAVFVTDGALLVEAGAHLRFDRLVVVHTAPAEQLRRLMQRDGITEAAARARIDAQMSVSEKRRFAHFEVDTSGRVEDTDQTADALAVELKAVASSLPPRVSVPRQRALASLLLGPRSGPRSLTPTRLLEEISAGGGLELDRVARLLEPPCPGPWYRCARAEQTGAGPERLAGPLVLWALTRGGPDPAFLVAAAASLARLTHADPAAVAAACLFALALEEAAVGTPLAGLPARLPAWRGLVERWAGGPPPPWIEAVLRASSSHPSHAAVAAGFREDDADLLGALTGMASGKAAASVPAPLDDAVSALEQIAARKRR